ncbi:hypothetical protein [Enterococcus gallinarum]|uniref:hypothetical protein n=1 Tax=Enterococcus gallinarum TaxID=1353 RepID=UPI001D172FD2|nr:hypothetical protein [Enterococcus gallinarum]MCC4044815.1 hypothetical protein [Enterococcus gallinarum]
MKQKWTVILILVTLLMTGVLIFNVINNRVPDIIGFFGSQNDNQKTQVTFDKEGRYVLYLDGKEYDHGEYDKSADHAYTLESVNNHYGSIILTNKQIFLIISTLQNDPILLDKISDAPTFIE